MNFDELAVFKVAVAVAAACRAEERPKPEEATGERVAQYVKEVLELVFNYSGIDFIVKPMQYPKASKVPVIIDLFAVGECLFWYYPYDNETQVAAELAGAMSTVMSEIMGLAEEGGVA